MKNSSEQQPLDPSYSTIPGKGTEPTGVSEIKIKDKSKEKMGEADSAVSQEQRSTTSDSAKQQDLAVNKSSGIGNPLTTNPGVKINDDHHTLKAGERGPSLLEDFIMREKITHFDHERIPERIVHARGSGAHGVFEVTRPIPEYTKAKFLSEKGKKTSVFVRFSTVAGERGSTDVPRDARGFAVKFYTEEGNYDLVANNMAPFFIHDAMKFPDLVHSLKPEPRDGIPQATGAHDTFWDFIATSPETMHMILWLMSDRAIPRSLRMMEGFGVHTFRFVNDEGKSSFVKFHLKPKLGLHSLAWDEAQKISGKDSDFHRRDLWDAIASGNFPEWEFGVQIVPEEDEFKFDFDLLDPTKIIPEELVPVMPVGTITLNRNPDNFFAETEQVAFHPGHVVPGIDFSNDPLLQGRLFSYTDTQLLRLGGPNFHEIPINRSVCPSHNNQRDAFHRQTIHKGRANYEPNSIDNGWPKETPPATQDGGFESYPERVEEHKIRNRSESFGDHFSQATLFWNSMSEPEKEHIIGAYTFELGRVERVFIRERQVNEILVNIDLELARRVAENLGLPARTAPTAPGKGSSISSSPALSLMSHLPGNIKSRKVAILVANGVDGAAIEAFKS